MKKQYITSDNTSDTYVKHLAQQINFTLWPSAQNPYINTKSHTNFPKALHVIAEQMNENQLEKLFKLPIRSIIDGNASDTAIHSFLKPEISPLYNNCLGVLLTCPVIYKCDLARIFTQALYERLHFSHAYYEAIHIVLHESIVNALIHGNLQLSSGLRQSARACIEYAHLLNERLNNPLYSKKSIQIWACWNHQYLDIRIRDEGIGYEIPKTLKKASKKCSATGRGLEMITGVADSCTISDSGREMRLSFRLTPQLPENENEISTETTSLPQIADLSKSQILIIEDNPVNRLLLIKLLKTMGISHIKTSANGIKALKKTEKFSFDLIILDLKIEGLSGYDVLNALKKNPKTAGIPVIIQTAAQEEEAREKVFAAGAVDFITKPVNPLEFFSRVKVHLENRLLINNLTNQLTRIESELQTAQQMQIQILPGAKQIEKIEQKYAIEIAHYFTPSSSLGGDFWQIFDISKTRVGIYLSDFSGHGIAAALNTFRLHTLISQIDKSRIRSPAVFLKTLNSRLYDLLPRGQFTTFFFGIIDTEEKTLRYASAGSVPPFLKTDNNETQLPSRGVPLGILTAPVYKENIVPFLPGSLLLLMSDALIEAKTLDGQLLGYTRFLKMARPFFKTSRTTLMLDKIMASFFQSCPPPPADDITIIAIRHKYPTQKT